MDDADTFKTEYAASGRSTCTKCRQPIGEGALRVGPMVQSTKGDFKYPMWHHFKCFEEGFMRKNAHKLTDVAQVSGIDRLKFEDQQKLKSLIVAADSKIAAKAVTTEEKELAAQSKTLWNYREKLDELSTGELQAMLTYNGQPAEGKIFGGRGKVLDRAADGMMFGALPKCTACKNGDMYVSHGKLKCTGHVDEFTRCEWTGTEDDIDRAEWKIPKSLQDSGYDFLDKYKFKAREKAKAIAGAAAAATTAAAAASASATKSSGTRRVRDDNANDKHDDGPDAPDQGGSLAPLAGIAVTCCGKLSKTQKEIEADVKKLGGTFVKTASGATVCIMTEDEAGKSGSKKGKEAVAAKILCVKEEWLDEIAKEGRIVKSGDNVLANADKRRPIVRKSAAEVKKEEDARAKKSAADAAQKSADAVKKFVVKGGSAVDPDCDLDHKNVKIYKSPSGDVFNVMMNNTDVTTGANSFYILQLIEHEDVRGRFTVFRKWGRMGNADIGGNKTTPFSSLANAQRDFESVYYDKTGNHWHDRKNFKKKPGKFLPVETTFDDGAGGGAEDAGPLDANYKGKLDRPTQNLVSLLFDIKRMTATLKELEIDTEKMPLGKLSQKTIMEGFKCLSDAQKIIEDPKFTTSTDPEWRPKVVSVTNRFYNYVPHTMPEKGGLPMLDCVEILQQKNDLLTSLQQMEVASKMIQSSGKTGEDGTPAAEHPLDASFKKLAGATGAGTAGMRTVDKNSEEFKRVNTYLQNTHAATHDMYTLELVDLWELDRPAEAKRFQKWEKNENRQLLWHGSRLTNWASILSSQLLIAPPSAPTTGYMFGKGVYFADMSSKSANYCFTNSENTNGIMLLSEVALGQMKTFKRSNYVDKLEKPYSSVKALGRTAPTEDDAYWQDNGCKVPMGKGTPSGVTDTSLLYNEYIVYDTDQIKMKYLLRVDFHYKRKYGFFH